MPMETCFSDVPSAHPNLKHRGKKNSAARKLVQGSLLFREKLRYSGYLLFWDLFHLDQVKKLPKPEQVFDTTRMLVEEELGC